MFIIIIYLFLQMCQFALAEQNADHVFLQIFALFETRVHRRQFTFD